MRMYYVKKSLFGVKADSVELFSSDRAALFTADGSIEPYDEKKHGDKPGSPARMAKEAQARQEKEHVDSLRRTAVARR